MCGRTRATELSTKLEAQFREFETLSIYIQSNLLEGEERLLIFFFSFLFLCVASKLCVCVCARLRATHSVRERERERETHLFESMKLS